MHDELFTKAKKARDENMKKCTSWEPFMDALNHKNIVLAPWCDTVECEVAVKDRSKEESEAYLAAHGEEEGLLTGSAKTLCIPFELGKQNFSEEDLDVCFACGKKATCTALWGRSY